MTRAVWYGPGDCARADTREDWAALPDGVQGVVEHEVDGRYELHEIIHRGDWYYWRYGRVLTVPCDRSGEWERPPAGVPRELVKRSGRSMPYDDWDVMFAEMEAWRP